MSERCPYCRRLLARVVEETIRANRCVCSCGREHWRCQWPTVRGSSKACNAVILDGDGEPAAELQRWCSVCQSIISVDAPRPVVRKEER